VCDVAPNVNVDDLCSLVSQPALPTVLHARWIPPLVFKYVTLANLDTLRTSLLVEVSTFS
jgi:hypothetical protein